MAPRIPVVLPSYNWPTKAATEADFQAILNTSGYAVYDTITDPNHDQMLRELLDRHPDAAEKIGAGVDFFFIGLTADGDKFNVRPDAKGIWIRRVDGSKVDFSYLTAIRKQSPQADAKEGLRIAVDDRRLAYRAKRFAAGTPVVSDISGTPIANREDGYVVHVSPTWGQLTHSFAMSEGGWTNVKVASGYGAVKIGSTLVDPAMETRWLAFYDKHANPIIATQSESARRPRGDDTAWTP